MIGSSFRIRALVGATIMAAVLLALGAGGSASAQPLPPRPPTAVPQPTHTPQSGGRNSTVEATGRITGTVIDQTTGAPAPGIAVVVGDVTVQTDQNGNYDRQGLAPGAYQIRLDLQPNQGTPEQGALQVDLAADATVVQHLAFRSQPAATPAPAAVPPAQPKTLPVTAGAERNFTWLWIVAAMLLASGMCLARVSMRD